MVHVLRHGRTLCLAVHGLPQDWSPQHTWVGFLDVDAAQLATCPTCRQALALIPRDVLQHAAPRSVFAR